MRMGNVKVDISQVEEILGLYKLIPKPQNVIIVKEPVEGRIDSQEVLYRGLTSHQTPDTIVLTSLAKDDTVVHECLHTMGFGELGAEVLGKLLIRKYRILRNFPVLKQLVSRPVEYEKCSGCKKFQVLHEKYPAKAEHYVRKA